MFEDNQNFTGSQGHNVISCVHVANLIGSLYTFKIIKTLIHVPKAT